MGYKKAPTKKKKKSKKKSAADKEWSFEGGQEIIEYNNSNTNHDIKKQRRQTQDRDERLRRGRRKLYEKNEKLLFQRKMSKKVSFQDILQDNNEDKNDIQHPTKKIRKEPPIRTNSIPLFERLQSMISLSRQNNTDGSHTSIETDTEDEDEVNDEVSYEPMNENEVSESEDIEVDILHKSDIEESEENYEEDEEISPQEGYFDVMFTHSEENSTKEESSKLSPLNTLSSGLGTFYGALTNNASPPNISRVGHIPNIHSTWKGVVRESISNELSRNLLSYLSTFADMFIEGRDHTNDNMIATAVLRHLTVHTMHARDIVVRNDKKLKRKAAKKKALSKSTSKKDKMKNIKSDTTQSLQDEDHNDEIGFESDDDKHEENGGTTSMQDEGYTRARVLILCPFRSSALELVNTMREFLGIESTTVTNYDKFLSEYSLLDEDEDASSKQKPKDWQAVFTGNLDDDLKLGIQLNPGQGKNMGDYKGAHMRLYSDFYLSDIILASPLGLRLSIENTKDKGPSDFLSSLEVVYLHQADVLYMQNWSHVEFLLKHSNKLPVVDHGVDFSRIRPYFLDGNSDTHRQLIMSSNFNDPSLQSTFREFGKSMMGTVRLRKDWSEGCISDVVARVKQVFYVVPTSSLMEEDNERFSHFCDNVLTQVLRLKQAHTLIVTPSYLSYVRVRNELIRREASAAFVCEYSRESEISRGRSYFFHGKRDILLYSGRSHFFRRFRIRGALHLIFYSLPEYANFYPEIVNALGEAQNVITSCLVLCTKYERMALERIVGTKRCAHMLSAGKTTFMFC